ncbi:MAG: single-stranded-DNA-specific exonuclease RecJ [Candidatus Omnitrophica bacterium]|nr:single-stranded-DNA-specific exonuclease RecJ [Candidatus Omnitrophota bacterium]
MAPLSPRWSLAPAQPALAALLADDLGISPLLAQCLLNRGLSEPSEIAAFLRPRLSQLDDPFRLPNMERAVDRLFEARRRAEAVTIFGDYDVDGITATALLVEVLQSLGWHVNYFLPHRLEDGYGLNQEGVEKCLERFPVALLLAVDCGSTAVGTIGWLRERGIDVIVLDHHQVSSPPPPAVALVNPLMDALDTTSPASTGQERPGWCSAGLAFKLAHALVKRGRQAEVAGARNFDLRPLLDLVALGTIADLVPLTEENRVLVAAGLQRLGKTQRPGLRVLKEVAQVGEPVSVYAVGFQLAPRLNAAGRLEDADAALRLLLERDLEPAKTLAAQLDAQNRQRQLIEQTIVKQVIGALRARFNPAADYVIVEGQLLWHIGVVGIVAARVLREFHRPTIILGGKGKEWRGSGRSIAGFDLAAALRACGHLLISHGGHAMAAGLTIDPAQIDAFRERINELARGILKAEDLRPCLPLDAVTSLADFTEERLNELELLEPVGQGNPTAKFAVRNVQCSRPPQRLGKQRQHARLWITDGSVIQEAVWWQAGDAPLPEGTFDLAFAPTLNEFKGQRTIQLKVLDWRPSATPSKCSGELAR